VAERMLYCATGQPAVGWHSERAVAQQTMAPAGPASADALVRFGPFEVSLQAETIRRDGSRVRLQQQPFQVLAMLLERPGEIVTREELRQRLWPEGLHVDFEHGLNTAIKKLRLALHDSMERPSYVETVRGRGYRLVAPVERIERPRGLSRDAARPVRRARWLGIAPVALAAAAAVTVAVILGRHGTPAPRITPLTSYPGREYQPTFSPDGSHVAFLWHRNGSYDIYIQPVGVLKPRPLTEGPELEHSPAWSPDGRWIAFIRDPAEGHGRARVLVKPPSAVRERVVTEYAFRRGGRVRLRRIAWGPDSRHLVLSRPDADGPTWSLYRVDTRSGEEKRLTESPTRDSTPAVSPDGATLAFARELGSYSELYLLPLSPELTAAGRPRRLVGRDQFRDVHLSTGLMPAWTRDGREVVFAGFPRAPYLYRVNASGAPRVRRVPAAGDLLLEPAVCPGTGRLAYASWTTSHTIMRLEIGPGSGAPASPVAFGSSRHDTEPRFSPDGRTVAFASTRLGPAAVWLSRPDGSGLRRLTASGVEPAWSPDGQWIAYSTGAEIGRQADIYVTPLLGGVPRRLTVDPAEDRQPAWSPDGQWIYFVSNRDGGTRVWRKPLAGGMAERVNLLEGTQPALSPDGRFLFARGWPNEYQVWRRTISGGAEEVILTSVDPSSRWCVTRTGIHFFGPAAPDDTQELLRYEFATSGTRRLAVVDGPVGQGLTVSPDGTVVLFSKHEHVAADLQVIEDPPLE